MEDDISLKLRKENAHLLSKLKAGASKLRHSVYEAENNSAAVLKKEKQQSSRAAKMMLHKSQGQPKKFRPTNGAEESGLPKPNLHQPERGQAAGKRVTRKSLTKTSTPMCSLANEGKSKERNVCVVKTKTPKSKNLPRSILVTPDTRKSKTPKQAKPKVTFPSSLQDNDYFLPESQVSEREKSLLGYDWIAGTLDNDSTVTEQSDQFFEEIKEFRRVNRDECISKETPFLGVNEYIPKSPKKAVLLSENENERQSDICCGSTYTINGRLNPVPIHGPYSQCPVCKTKDAPESEYDNSYVRVSIPRSTLQSPYRIKPHRRKSFDPSDSLALSEHCLAGWQCARPAYAPGPDNLDLKSSVKTETGLSVLGGGSTRRNGYQRQTEELLNTTIGLRHGLQLLERDYQGQKRANSTSYPAF